MPRSYTKNIALFDGSSGESSTFTTNWNQIADFDVISVSWATSAAVASRLTLQGSNDLGTLAAITDFSNLTGITVAGVYTVDPGVRFVRALRSSNESLSRVRLQLSG